MSLKQKIKNLGKTEYSKDKEFLNAVIMSDASYVPKKKELFKTFRLSMFAYAITILFVTLLSLGIMGLTDDYVSAHKGWIATAEIIIFIVLLVDVVLRWYTSEARHKKGNWSYLLFPVSISGIILIASLLPSLYLINVWAGKDIAIFNTFENMKFLRIFRIILLANLVQGVGIFARVLKKEKSVLYVVFSIVIISIVLFALVIFNIEQGVDTNGLVESSKPFKDSSGQMVSWKEEDVQFKTFWDALYFSTITLTTIGFGDKSPSTDMGKAITMIMSIIGIAVLATPSGVIAGGFISEIKQQRKAKDKVKSTKK